MMLAQAPVTTEWLAPLTNIGVAGWMIWFLTSKGQESLKNLTQEIVKMRGAMDRWSKTQLIALLTHPGCPVEARQPAKTMLEEIDQVDK